MAMRIGRTMLVLLIVGAVYLSGSGAWEFKRPTSVSRDRLSEDPVGLDGSIQIAEPTKQLGNKDRAFGLFKILGFDVFANYLLNSLTFTTTSTTTLTTTSTISVTKLVTCFTSSMFSFTTACRRKRNVITELVVGDSDALIVASPVLPLEPTAAQSMTRESRRLHTKVMDIASSRPENPQHQQVNEPDGQSNTQNRFLVDETLYVATTTFTSYYLYTRSTTTTITGLAATTALSCLPAGATLC